MLVITYKTLYGLASHFCWDCLFQVESIHPTQSSRERMLQVPTPKEIRDSEKHILRSSPSLWNSMPLEVRCAPPLMAFSKVVKIVLFQWAFRLENLFKGSHVSYEQYLIVLFISCFYTEFLCML